MLSLPELDTVNFTALLPLTHQPLPNEICPPELQRETRLALRVLASEVKLIEEPDSTWLQQLDAKLDLVLEISLRGRHPNVPPRVNCRLGLEAIVWHSTQPYRISDTLLVSLNPNPDEALQLYLLGKVTACQSIDGHNITMDIRPSFDKASQSLWEKWVFRRHRLAILER